MILNGESPEAWRVHTINDSAPTLYAERPPRHSLPAICAFGINTKQSQGTTFYREISGTLSVCHEMGVITILENRRCQ